MTQHLHTPGDVKLSSTRGSRFHATHRISLALECRDIMRQLCFLCPAPICLEPRSVSLRSRSHCLVGALWLAKIPVIELLRNLPVATHDELADVVSGGGEEDAPARRTPKLVLVGLQSQGLRAFGARMRPAGLLVIRLVVERSFGELTIPPQHNLSHYHV